MLNDRSIYFLGYSGHAYVAMDVAKANGLSILGYFEKSKKTNNPFNLKYCGYEQEVNLNEVVKNNIVFPAIGSNKLRQKMYQKLYENDIQQIVLKHPSAIISDSSHIRESTLINPNVTINSFVKIGKCCIINTGVIIEHESEIGNFTHIAPGAILAGNVRIGKQCFIGAGSVIKQGVTIADQVVIGAGAVVLKDIEEKGTWVGNPAKLLKK